MKRVESPIQSYLACNLHPTQKVFLFAHLSSPCCSLLSSFSLLCPYPLLLSHSASYFSLHQYVRNSSPLNYKRLLCLTSPFSRLSKLNPSNLSLDDKQQAGSSMAQGSVSSRPLKEKPSASTYYIKISCRILFTSSPFDTHLPGQPQPLLCVLVQAHCCVLGTPTAG